MNGSNQSRYYKLNLQNLVTGRQPTIEFRQHSATFEYNKVRAWISFCVWLVWNSARLRTPSSFSATTTLQDQFQALICFLLVQDFPDLVKHLYEMMKGTEANKANKANRDNIEEKIILIFEE